jgi:hypothetical protein
VSFIEISSSTAVTAAHQCITKALPRRGWTGLQHPPRAPLVPTMMSVLGAALLLVRAAAVVAAGTNVTLDDAASEGVVYTGSWNDGPACGGCFVQPNPARCLDGTWHDGTANPGQSLSVALSFTGPCRLPCNRTRTH